MAREARPRDRVGLAVVEALAERWGGEVRLEEREGGGTRAEVRLPGPALTPPCPILSRRLRRPYPSAPRIDVVMDLKRAIRNAALALLGLVAAVAIGLVANSVSGDSVGLSAQPLSAGDSLAPQTQPADTTAAERRRRAARRERERRDRTTEAPAQSPAVPAPASPTVGGRPSTSDGDSDSSGSGSGGSDDSDSSGSGGGDDSGRGRGRGRGRGGDSDDD